MYRSTDGGAHWKKVLLNAADPKDVGAIDIAIDPKDPRVLYASLWATRRPPWAVYAPSYMPGSGLYKSTDGGDHWTQLHGGLPDDPFVGKIGIAVAPSNPNRLWAVVDDIGRRHAPSYRGAHEPRGRSSEAYGRRVSSPTTRARRGGWSMRRSGCGDAAGTSSRSPSIRRIPDEAYVINTATYRTMDAGKTFVPIKAAPGGDDYHQLWINPNDRNRMVLSSDQGTVVSVDGAKTWSTWYNQPTAEIYHVAADNRFPYWL